MPQPPPEKLGLGYGINQTLLNIGMLIAPALTGLARDISGSYQASYTLIAVFSFMIPITAIFLTRKSHNRQPAWKVQSKVLDGITLMVEKIYTCG